MILRKIANTLYLNIQHISADGLLNGKLGVVLFMYHYALYSKQDHYRNFSDLYIDNLYSTISNQMPLTFAEGLSGIGWALHHLIDSGILDGDSDDVLEEIDSAIASMDLNSDLSSEVPLFSAGIYFLKRQRSDTIHVLMQRLDDFLSKSNHLPASYINSVLYFIEKAYMAHIEETLCVQLLAKVNQHISSMNSIDPMNFIIYTNNISELKHIHTYHQLDTIKGIESDDIISAQWSNLCYPHTYSTKVDMNKVNTYIDTKICNLRKNDLYLYGGLSGLGLSLMI